MLAHHHRPFHSYLYWYVLEDHRSFAPFMLSVFIISIYNSPRSWCVEAGRRWRGRGSPASHRGADHGRWETQGGRAADCRAQRDLGGQAQENRSHPEREVNKAPQTPSQSFLWWCSLKCDLDLKTYKYMCTDIIFSPIYMYRTSSVYMHMYMYAWSYLTAQYNVMYKYLIIGNLFPLIGSLHWLRWALLSTKERL